MKAKPKGITKKESPIKKVKDFKISHVKKGDTVKILTGKDKGKTGSISQILSKENRVVVEGMNLLKRHSKAKKQGEKGTIVEIASPINASNVKKVN
jgi:large subunit ribosomal protein L24